MSDSQTVCRLIKKDFGKMNERQLEAVTQVEGPLLVLAGAGSGKTTVLVNRIAYLCKYGNLFYQKDNLNISENALTAANDYINGKSDTLNTDEFAVFPPKPYEILAITFTNKAANELKCRIENKLGAVTDIWAGTFHSICGKILRVNADRIGYSSHFTIYDTDDQKRIMKDVIKSFGADDKMWTPKAVLSAVSAAKDALVTPDEMLSSAGNDYRLKTVAQLYAEYQKKLISSDAMDFDDMIMNTVRLFRENPDLLEKYSRRFRYVMVDEYQDTNPAQYELVRLISSYHKNLCVVGDDDQSIYRFRGATIENILNFEDDFKNAKVIRLEQNYRSTSNILDAANGVIKNNLGRKGKVLWTAGETGDKISVFTARDQSSEAKYVCDSIESYVSSGGKFNDCAVLYRTNSQSAAFENVFSRSGISYKVIGGFRFYERKEIKDVLAYLCVINNKNDTVRLKRIINEPKRGIGETTVRHAEEIADTVGIPLFEVFETAGEFSALSRAEVKLKEFCSLINDISAAAENLSLGDLFDYLINQTGYKDAMILSGEDDREERLANIDELKNNIVLFEKENEDATLSDFLEEIALVNDIDSLNESDDKVTLMTIHAAKGLEFPSVYLVGMEEGLFPGNQSIFGGNEEIEEERRLAYVAITRAKRKLTITRALSRMTFGQTNRNLPSRFLKEIPEELCEYKEENYFGDTESYDRYGAEKVHVFGGGESYLKGKTAKYGMSSFSLSKQKSAETFTNTANYKVGDTVSHKVFGTGTVISVSPMGSDTLLEIAFETVGTKKLMANYAKLKVL